MAALIAPFTSHAIELDREAVAVVHGYGIRFQEMSAKRLLMSSKSPQRRPSYFTVFLDFDMSSLFFEEPDLFTYQIALRGFSPISVRIKWPMHISDDLCHPSACDKFRSLIHQKMCQLWCSPPSLRIERIGDVTERLPASLTVDPRDP